MMIRAAVRIIMLFVLVISAAISFGQVTTGIYPFGSFQSGPPDTVNLENLNVILPIKVMNKAGRGLPLDYTLIYNSSLWTTDYVNGVQTWVPAGNWGWGGFSQEAAGEGTESVGQDTCWDYTGFEIYINTYYDFAYIDRSGVYRLMPFYDTLYDADAENCDGGYYPEEETATSDDGLYTMDVYDGSISVYDRSGTTFQPPVNTLSGPSAVLDTNGNRVNSSVSGGATSFTDTLGHNALSISAPGSNPIYFTYTGGTGSPEQVSLTYSSYWVRTNFGCGIQEYGPQYVSLVSQVGLPDGSYYTITYEDTPGYSGYKTGRVAAIKLPTGATISYTYRSTDCTGQTTALTRKVSDENGDSTWTYSTVSVPSIGGSQTTVVDPAQNRTVVTFVGDYEVQRDTYRNGVQNSTETTYTCYNGAAYPCTSQAVGGWVSQKTVTTVLNGWYTQSATSYDNSYELPIEYDNYDAGNGAPGPLLKKTTITYGSWNGTACVDISNYIVDHPCQITVWDGAGHKASQTSYSYDESAVQPTSGTPQHANMYGSRGNPTTMKYWVSDAANPLTRTSTYYDTGNIYQATDVNGATTTYTYGACGNSFVTNVALPLSLSRPATWDCNGGVMSSSTDENSKSTYYAYDPYFWRLASVTDPNSNVTNYTYTTNSVDSRLLFNGNNSVQETLVTLDEQGRPHISQQRQGPSSSTYDSVETDYNSLGQTSRATLAYSGSAGATSGSAPGTTTSYDEIGRTVSVSDSGGGSSTYGYSKTDTLITVNPVPSGEHSKSRQYEYNGLGQLSSVCEITTTLSGYGTCSQTSPTTGYWTKYSYNPLGELTSVTQNAQGTSQSRTFTYDGLGRKTSGQTPEANNVATTYGYDQDANCSTTFKGDLVSKTDAAGNRTCYYYDALHRLTDQGTSGPNATSCRRFRYDNSSGVLGTIPTGVSVANTMGRLVEAETDTCAWPVTQASIITDEWFSYDTTGKLTDVYEWTLHSGGYYHVTAGYFANGTLSGLSNLVGLPAINYGIDGEGRPYSASANGATLVSSTSYTVAGAPSGVTLGSSDSDSFGYDTNTDRMAEFQHTINGASLTGTLGWNANGTLRTLSITDPFNGANSQTCTYTYDDLSRVANVDCGSAWQQSFSFDPFGNLAKSGSWNFGATYSTSTNRITSVPGYSYQYDANGDVTSDSSHTYGWDALGEATSVDSVSLTYDALGRMVEQNRSGSYTQIVYGPDGSKLALMNGRSLQKAFVPLAGGATAVYNSGGLAYYRHPDWLGSSRLASTPSRTVYSDVAYAPYGEQYAQSGNTDVSFTGQNQDTTAQGTTGLYDFPFREFHPVSGRWITPDPSGLAAANLSNPQSLNRYAYVSNNPLNATDPTGLVEDDGWGGDWGGFPGFCPAEFSAEDCGFWFPPIWLPPIIFGSGGPGGTLAPQPAPPKFGPVYGNGNPPLSGETLGIPNGYSLPSLTMCQTIGVCPIQPGCDFGVCGGSGFQAAAIPLGVACLTDPICAGIAAITTGAVVLHYYGPQILHFAKETGTLIDAYNDLLQDFQNCNDAYPPGPERERCHEAARQRFRIRTGKPLPGPKQ